MFFWEYNPTPNEMKDWFDETIEPHLRTAMDKEMGFNVRCFLGRGSNKFRNTPWANQDLINKLAVTREEVQLWLQDNFDFPGTENNTMMYEALLEYLKPPVSRNPEKLENKDKKPYYVIKLTRTQACICIFLVFILLLIGYLN